MRPLLQLSGYEIGLATLFGMLMEEVWEEKQLQDEEHDEQLDGNDKPERLAQLHVAKPIVIEIENPAKEALFS